ncbi:MAG: alternative ribosome rescue aminoacyl-tRNA hydrolase ArfB [Pirellulales bacterium]
MGHIEPARLAGPFRRSQTEGTTEQQNGGRNEEDGERRAARATSTGAAHDRRIYWSYRKGPIVMPQTLDVNARIRIPLDELRMHYVRSSGPGGQNVNKVNTKAVLTWTVAQSPHLPADVRTRFLAKYGRRLSVEGRLVITSQRYREQGRNRTDCLEKLRRMLTAVAVPPLTRKRTRPSLGAVERRLRAKREQSDRKRQRRVRPGPDD